MAYDEGLAERLEEVIEGTFDDIGYLDTKKMFGGFGYLLKGNMCFGIIKDTLMIRVGVEVAEQLIAEEPHVREMDFTGRVMKGWAIVEPEGMAEDEDLQRYCSLSMAFVRTLPEKP